MRIINQLVHVQGRLEPVEAFLNKNKRGLGAEKMQKPQRSENAQLLGANRKNDKVSSISLEISVFCAFTELFSSLME